MLAPDARRALVKLVIADAWSRYRIRFRLWAAVSLAVWSLATLSSVVLDYPALVYHALLMTTLGSLPLFIYAPQRGDPFTALVRSVDRKSALEAWLAYRSGPALPLLAKRAEELLRVRSLYRPSRPPVGVLAPALAVTGLAALILAQVISIASGFGMSLGYADKSALAEAGREAWLSESPTMDRTIVAPTSEKPEAPQTGVRERPGASAEQAGNPSVSAIRSRRPGNEPVDQAPLAAPDSEASAGGTGDGSGPPGGGSGEEAPNPDALASGESSNPGFKGSGTSLLPSPLLDYRAVFESQYVERTGKESALGSAPSAEQLEQAVGEYFGSFDTRVILGPAVDPALQALKAAWLSATAEGGQR